MSISSKPAARGEEAFSSASLRCMLVGGPVYSDVVFGLGYMVGVSSILAFPLAVAVGLLRRWPEPPT